MVPQSFDLEDRFLLQPFGKLRLIGIDAAAHGKILPHQNALSVTEIEKFIRFIHIAAPAAHHIAPNIVQKLQCFGQSGLIVIMQCIQRHPVGAQDEYFFAVDTEAECTVSIGIGNICMLQLHSADAVGKCICIANLSVVQKRYRHIVQVLRACVFGPPKLTRRDLKKQLGRGMP